MSRTEELKSLLADYLNSQGLELVELTYRYTGRDWALRIFLDKPQGGITLYDCAYLNREISRIIEERQIIDSKYILEVSSPGLDRPLKIKSDFSRCLSRMATFFLKEAVGGRLELKGIISKVEEDAVYIEQDGETVILPFSKISQAKQIVNNT